MRAQLYSGAGSAKAASGAWAHSRGRTDAISLSMLSTVSSSITVLDVIDRIAVASLDPSSANTILAAVDELP